MYCKAMHLALFNQCPRTVCVRVLYMNIVIDYLCTLCTVGILTPEVNGYRSAIDITPCGATNDEADVLLTNVIQVCANSRTSIT